MRSSTRTLRSIAVAASAVLALLILPLTASAAGLQSAPTPTTFRDSLRETAPVPSGEPGGYLGEPVTIEEGDATRLPSGSLLRDDPLPSSFDARAQGWMTAVRNQNRYRSCWAFATMSVLETYLMPGAVWDFSEDNLVMRSGFFPYDTKPELYGEGGTYTMSAAYLARWSGPLTEATDPYDTPYSNPTGPVKKHVQGMAFLPTRSGALDNDTIKQAVLSYGAVAVGMEYQDGGFNDAADAYYYAGADFENHGVVICGWDDAFWPAGGWGSSYGSPGGAGAFLVRNSWGSGWGDGGYFWVSYYDTAIARLSSPFVITQVESTTNFKRHYGHDRYGWWDSVGTGSETGWFGNRFTAKESNRLTAVSFYTPVFGSTYRVYAGPTFAKKRLRATGTAADAGYVTVRLDSPMRLAKGNKFVVAVRLTTPGYSYPIPLEIRWPGVVPAAASAGQSYVSFTNGSSWSDLTRQYGHGESNVCLKAFSRR